MHKYMTLENLIKNLPGKKTLTNLLIGLSLIATTPIVTSCNKDERVEISSQYTNSNGVATFTDSQTDEEVNIYIREFGSGIPVQGAEVTFIDGNGFEAFETIKDEYVENFQLFPHNSNHYIDIIHEGYNSNGSVPFTVWESIHEGNQEEILVTWDNYTKWVTNGDDQYEGYDFDGCMTKEEIETEGDRASVIIGTGISIFGTPALGVAWTKLETVHDQFLDFVDIGQQVGIFNGNESEAYDVYTPRGFYAPPIMIGHNITNEVAEDGIDNDCNDIIDDVNGSGNNNGVGSGQFECSGEYFCDNFNGNSLNTIDWDREEGALVSGGYLELDEFNNSIHSRYFNIENNFTLKASFIPSNDYLILIADSSSGYHASIENDRASCLNYGIDIDHDNSQNINPGSGRQNLEIILSGGRTKIYLNNSEVLNGTNCYELDGDLQIRIANRSNNSGLRIDYISLDD